MVWAGDLVSVARSRDAGVDVDVEELPDPGVGGQVAEFALAATAVCGQALTSGSW
jgi:hypothetical protein